MYRSIQCFQFCIQLRTLFNLCCDICKILFHDIDVLVRSTIYSHLICTCDEFGSLIGINRACINTSQLSIEVCCSSLHIIQVHSLETWTAIHNLEIIYEYPVSSTFNQLEADSQILTFLDIQEELILLRNTSLGSYSLRVFSSLGICEYRNALYLKVITLSLLGCHRIAGHLITTRRQFVQSLRENTITEATSTSYFSICYRVRISTHPALNELFCLVSIRCCIFMRLKLPISTMTARFGISVFIIYTIMSPTSQSIAIGIWSIFCNIYRRFSRSFSHCLISSNIINHARSFLQLPICSVRIIVDSFYCRYI